MFHEVVSAQRSHPLSSGVLARAQASVARALWYVSPLRGRGGCSLPEVLMHNPGFILDEWSFDDHGMLATGENVAARDQQIVISGRHGCQVRPAKCKDNATDARPIDCARAHRARLGAGIHCRRLERCTVEMFERQSCQVDLGVSRDIFRRDIGILAFRKHRAVRAHQQRPEGMVAVIACACRDRDRRAEVFRSVSFNMRCSFPVGSGTS